MNARLTLLAPLLLAGTAFAATQEKTVSILAGADRGGLALGANFDVNDTANEAYGGYARVFSKDKKEGAPALFAVGGEFRGQVKVGLIQYYMSPGFGIIQHTYDDTKLLVGPSLAYGMTAELDKMTSIGIENTKLYSWGGKYKGLIADAFLAQFRFSFY